MEIGWNFTDDNLEYFHEKTFSDMNCIEVCSWSLGNIWPLKPLKLISNDMITLQLKHLKVIPKSMIISES